MAVSPLRRILRLLGYVLFAVVLWAGWYGAKRGLTRRWRERVFAELRARGVEVVFKKLTVDPLRGFVAREVTVFDAEDHQRVLAEIDRLSLSLDWGRLLRKRAFVSALELNDASLSVPLERSNPTGRRVSVTHLRARLLLPEKQSRLVHAEARVLGLRLSAQGRLANPQAWEGSASKSSPEMVARLEEVLKELESVRWQGEAPRVQLRFSGDLNVPQSVAASLQVETGEFEVRGMRFEGLSVTALWREGALELQDFALTDKGGRMHAVARWLAETGAFEGRADSTLDPVQIAKAAGEGLPEGMLQFAERPLVRVHVRGGQPGAPGFSVTAGVECGGFSLRKEPFLGLKAAASWEGERWSVRELSVRHKEGTLTGDVLSAPGEFRVKLESTLPPSLAELAYAQAPINGPMRWLQTRDPVRLLLEAHGKEPRLEVCTLWGSLQVGRATFRGVGLERMDTPFRVESGVLQVGPFRLKRPEGVAEGSITYDTVRNDLFIHKVRLRLTPVEAMKIIEPEWVSEVSPYRFRGPAPLVTVDGKAAPGTPDRTDLTVTVASQGGMDYDFAGKTLPFDQISAQLLFTPGRVRIQQLSGKIFNGLLEGNADISNRVENTPHKASLVATDVDFASLSRLYTGYDDSKGKLNCSFLWKGESDEGRKVDGSGELTITDGNVFAIPFLGPFSGILNSIIPGAGYNQAHKATASFTVKEGVFNTQNLRIESKAFTLLGHGNLHFLDDKMRFFARINSRGLPSVMLFPVSKLFEYSADCKLSKPVWKPRIINHPGRTAEEREAP